MKKNSCIVLVLLLSIFTTPANAQRMVKDLNFGWQFRLNNEGEWRTVDVPHDFQIEQPWVAPAADERPDNTDVAANIKSRLSSRGFKEMAKGYYRYHLTPTPDMEGRRILLDFEGIMYQRELFGSRVSATTSMRLSFPGFTLSVTSISKPTYP